MRIISGSAKGKVIFAPVDKKTRPLKDMVRGAIFNIISHSKLLSVDINKCIVLDLFSGVGSFGLEAISRGVKKVIFFENYKPALDLLFKNLNKLSFNKSAEVNEKNVNDLRNLENLNYNFNIVFIDPPFKDKNLIKILESLKNFEVVNLETLIIIHRHKNTKDDFKDKLKIAREEIYGSSKIIFGYIIS